MQKVILLNERSPAPPGIHKTLQIMGWTTNLNWLAGFLPSTSYVLSNAPTWIHPKFPFKQGSNQSFFTAGKNGSCFVLCLELGSYGNVSSWNLCTVYLPALFIKINYLSRGKYTIHIHTFILWVLILDLLTSAPSKTRPEVQKIDGIHPWLCSCSPGESFDCWSSGIVGSVGFCIFP